MTEQFILPKPLMRDTRSLSDLGRFRIQRRILFENEARRGSEAVAS